ncbi:ribonuclease H-like domain-containing protein [Tanacetum coccineum]
MLFELVSLLVDVILRYLLRAWYVPLSKKYAMELLEQAHMVNYNPTLTLVDTESKLGPDGDPPHLADLKCVLCYVRGTLDFGLQLYASPIGYLVAYYDADRAGSPSTRRSTSGYCDVVNAVAETVWIRNLLWELHSPLLSTTLVYCDNVSTIYLTTNLVQHQRTKHVEIDIHFVRDMVTRGQV